MTTSRDSDIARALMDQVIAARETHERRRAEMVLNAAALQGYQDIQYSRSRGVVFRRADRRKPNRDKVEEHQNRLLQTYRWWIRKIFKTKPQLTAHAGGREIVDSMKANVAEVLFDYWHANNGWREAQREAARWVFTAGHAYLEPYWKTDTGRTVTCTVRERLDEPIEIEVEGTKRRSYTRPITVEQPSGDLAFAVHRPDSVYTYPLQADTWQKVESVIMVDMVTRADIEAFLGKTVDEADYQVLERDQMQIDAMADLGRLNGTADAAHSGSYVERRYLQVQLRERPTRERPDGRWTVVAGGRVLHEGPLPYAAEARKVDPVGAFNLALGIIPWYSEPVPGDIQPPAMATALRHKQADIASLRRDGKANRRSVGRSYVLAPKRLFKDQELEGDIGQILTYDDESGMNGAPNLQIVQGQPLIGLLSELEEAKNDYDESAGRSMVLQGRNDSQVRSGFHFSMVYEEAIEHLALDIEAHEEAHGRVGRLALAIAVPRMTEDQVIRIFGKDRSHQARTFMELDIAADIRIEEGSSIPRNHAAVQAQVYELISAGMFQYPPEVQVQIFDALDLGANMPQAYVERQLVVDAARRRFYRILYTGETIAPSEYDDHAVFIGEFRRLMHTPQYEEADDRVKMAVHAYLITQSDIQARQMGFGEAETGQANGMLADMASRMGTAGPPPAGMAGPQGAAA